MTEETIADILIIIALTCQRPSNAKKRKTGKANGTSPFTTHTDARTHGLYYL
jgi:hypothetical protein